MGYLSVHSPQPSHAHAPPHTTAHAPPRTPI
jgi:hypothetical protein